MEATMQGNAGGARTQDLIATVSAISNSLMNEVSKVIIGKNENLRRVTVGILSVSYTHLTLPTKRIV